MKPHRAPSGEHIALLLPDLRAGGAQRVFLTLAREFAARGIRVDLVLAIRDGELLAEVPPNVRLVALRRREPVFGRAALAGLTCVSLVRYLRRNRPRALLSTLTGTNLVAIAASRIARTPTRVIVREAATLENLRHRLYRFLMRRLYGKADTVVVLTSTMKEEMERVIGLPPERVACIPNPVDSAQLHRDAQAPLPEDFDANSPYALAVGRLWPQKDYRTLIDAFAIVARPSSLRLVILGDGPDRPVLEARVRQLALDDRVELRGFDPNPYRWMAGAAFFVLSSRWEGYPNAVAEARTLGCPIVMTEYDASAGEVGGKNAFLAPAGDPQALAQAMLQAFETRDAQKAEPLPDRDVVREYLRELAPGSPVL